MNGKTAWIVGVLSALTFWLSGCATLINSEHQSVLISSTPGEAAVTIDDRFHVLTPGKVSLSRQSDHVARVEMQGYEPTLVLIERGFSWWVLSDLFCLVLIPYCVREDIRSGGFYAFDDEIHVTLITQNPAIDVVKLQSLTTDTNGNTLPDVGDVVTYSYTVENTGDVTLSNVALVDDVEGTLTLSDGAGDGVAVLAVGARETASSAHTVTQAEFDAGTLTNIATGDGDSPLTVTVSDTDTQTVTFTQKTTAEIPLGP